MNEEFEKWARDEADLGDYLGRITAPSGQTYYRDESVHYTWLAWQASRKQAVEECAAICDEQAKEPECPERASYCAAAIRAMQRD